MFPQLFPCASISNAVKSFLKEDHCPAPAGYTSFDTDQDAIGFLVIWAHSGSCSGAVDQDPQILLLQFFSHSSLSLKHHMELL